METTNKAICQRLEPVDFSIEVTADHIKDGISSDCRYCPVALAVGEHINTLLQTCRRICEVHESTSEEIPTAEDTISVDFAVYPNCTVLEILSTTWHTFVKLWHVDELDAFISAYDGKEGVKPMTLEVYYKPYSYLSRCITWWLTIKEDSPDAK